MIDSERLELDFEDVLCGATEQFTGLEIYNALNKAINKWPGIKTNLKLFRSFNG